jgi:hypothetical protein
MAYMGAELVGRLIQELLAGEAQQLNAHLCAAEWHELVF